ncbi:Schwann cell myelin protein-like [Mya arenaria]|uniref:Schwann cell myelin protein-like n=1 Tax=Mya arenaria TaxID=6604 RepID=UPI0022E54A1B|nr:Schwann cell myelin protein-like [Mya arenaria]
MNTSYGSTDVGRNNSSFYLDILYPPRITNLNAFVKVLEGVHFSFTCEAEPGNSKETSYFWTSQQLPGINIFGQYLIIQNISRADDGIYTCFARNVMQPSGCMEINGSDVKNITIDVQYKASIITFTAMNTTTTTTVHHGDEVRFACEVDSDPPADIRILSTNGSILKNINDNYLLSYTKNSSCLEDIGQFTCISANKHNRGQPDKRNVSVDVKCSPLYRPNYFQNSTFKTRPGTKIKLHFSVFSNPPPTQFIWTNISNSMQLPNDTTSDRVIINTSDDMSSSLIITSAEPWDSGNYSVRVENEIGSMVETFHIIVDSNPEPDGETYTSPTSDNGTGSVVGGIVGAVSFVVAVAILIAIFFYKKRQCHHDGDRRRDGSALKDDTRYEDLTMAYTRTPTDYSDLDFRCRTGITTMQTKTKESDVYENLKLTPTKSSALT